MYQTHYHLKTQPFSEHAAATSLWLDDRMQQGLARLAHLVEHATLGLVTGPTGVGKSALLKRFLHELSRQQCESVYCHLTHLKSTGMLKMILSRLGEVPRRGKERLFEQILERAARAESKLLLIMDEAHLLEGEALTDLRLLVSSAIDVAPPLKILLVGQEMLRATLKQSQHQALPSANTTSFKPSNFSCLFCGVNRTSPTSPPHPKTANAVLCLAPRPSH